MKIDYYEDEMRLFWEFIQERHLIYKRKEIQKLPPPWTDNEILRNFKFTNVVRSLDRGTKFVTDYILKQDLNDLDMVFNIIVYRLINKIETFMHHGIVHVDTYDKDKFLELLESRAEVDNIFTNAFVVSGLSSFGSGMPKIERMSILIDQLAQKLKEDLKIGYNACIWESTDMGDTYYYLLTIHGIGPFLGYQMAVDLSYWGNTKFGEDEFVIDGPGAMRGLQELFTNEMIRQHGYEYLNFWLRDKQLEFYQDYGIDHIDLFDDQDVPWLTVMSLENCLCEVSKYLKAVRGEGRPRNTYNEKEGLERMTNNRDAEWNE